MNKALLAALALLLAKPAMAAATLCQPREKVVFACTTGKKLVSVCASEGLKPGAGAMYYRFGTKDKIELAFPEAPTMPAKFASVGSLMYSGGGATYLRLQNGGYHYVAYSGMGKGWDKQGVAVEKGGKIVANLLCKDLAGGDLESMGFFEKAGIPEDKSGFEIP